MKELEIDATVENLTKVLMFVDAELESVDCPMKSQMQIDIAVEEIYVNIAHYAYKEQGITGRAWLRMDISGDPMVATFTFIDQGVPYNPLAKPDPDITLSADERQIGGLGIYMVKESMEDLSYEYADGSNVFTFKKTLKN